MTTTEPRVEQLAATHVQIDTLILAPVKVPPLEVVVNWHRQEHTGRIDDCLEQPCKEFARTKKHPSDTWVVEQWHREVHWGHLEHCTDQPCHAVARAAELASQ